MEAKQISLFCLLLATLAGKIETKPSGSLNSVGLTAEEAQLGSIRAASVGQSNVDHFSSDLSGYGGTLGNYERQGGFGQGFGLSGIHGQSGCIGQGLASGGSCTSSLGRQGIGNQGLGGYFGNCQQGIGRIGIPVNSGCGTYQQFTPGCNIYGGGFDQQLSNPGFSSLDIGQQLSNPGFSSLDIGQQLNSGLGNLGTSQGSNLDISALTGRFNDAGLDYLYSPCTSCNQDLGFNNILGNSRGCQSGSQGIPFGTGCGTYQQSLSPFTTGCNDFDLSCQQGITASTSCGVCQGITGTNGCGYCQSGAYPNTATYNCLDLTNQQSCTSCSENTCASCVDQGVEIVELPVAECGVEPTCTETC